MSKPKENLNYMLGLDARGVTLDQQSFKMDNLTRLSKGGRVIKAIRHNCYVMAGSHRFYNPYQNRFHGGIGYFNIIS
ncbi:MAG TPA: hypothetical protein VMW50_12140 [Dehalococcoidia bacterium]|nr:hypothetical protein [Dehalococcoidia bacterium]